MNSASTAVSLSDSYDRCIEIAKTRAANFYRAFEILPSENHRGICALYAFARLADDYSDDETDPDKALANAQRLRKDLERALAGTPNGHPALPAVVDTVHKFKIDPKYLYQLLDGTAMDASKHRFETWQETYDYCYHVASVVGIMTIHVFGFRDPDGDALHLAEETGIAFQLTNILRDIKEDSERGRIYLPLEDLRRFNVPEEDVLACKLSPQLRQLIAFEVDRARAYYQSGKKLVPLIDKECRPAYEVLVEIYHALLEKFPKKNYDVLSGRISLSFVEKARLASKYAAKMIMKK